MHVLRVLSARRLSRWPVPALLRESTARSTTDTAKRSDDPVHPASLPPADAASGEEPTARRPLAKPRFRYRDTDLIPSFRHHRRDRHRGVQLANGTSRPDEPQRALFAISAAAKNVCIERTCALGDDGSSSIGRNDRQVRSGTARRAGPRLLRHRTARRVRKARPGRRRTQTERTSRSCSSHTLRTHRRVTRAGGAAPDAARATAASDWSREIILVDTFPLNAHGTDR